MNALQTSDSDRVEALYELRSLRILTAFELEQELAGGATDGGTDGLASRSARLKSASPVARAEARLRLPT